MKNKIPYLIIIILLVFIAITYGKNLISNITPIQPNTVRTAETLDAWKAKWNNEVNHYCQSNIFSSVSPQFQRAVSLVLQRFWENEQTKNGLMTIRLNQFCLDIEYAKSEDEMSGAEGVFLFSNESSGPKGLKILVNPAYKLQDDVATALLLSHELTHAEQFILQDVAKRVIQECNNEASQSFCNDLKSPSNLGFYLEESPEACVRKEAQAFLTADTFYGTLKQVEQDNILLRANNVLPSQENLPIFGFAEKFRQLTKQCPNITGEDYINCLSNVYVRSEPFYQKECNL